MARSLTYVSLFIFLTCATAYSQSTQSMNPDISAILDGVGGFYQRRPLSLAGDDPDLGSDQQTRGGGFTLQEAEIALSSNVDAYFKGDLFLTIPNLGPPEVEEAYVTTTALPGDMQIKVGKFRSSTGRQNGQHLHLQDFTRRPLINQNFLGVDGLSAPGVQLSWLIPLPFYSIIAFEGLSPKAPDDSTSPVQTFGGGEKSDVASIVTIKNFFPVGEEVSIYQGFSYANGRSATAMDSLSGLKPLGNNSKTKLYGADLYLKYKPANTVAGFHSLAWQTEYYQRHFDGTELFGAQNDGGLYTQIVYQLAQRWLLGARADFLGLPTSQFVHASQRYSSSLTFVPTEFSRLRLYGETETQLASDYPAVSPVTNVAVLLQLEISMGAHGAHAF